MASTTESDTESSAPGSRQGRILVVLLRILGRFPLWFNRLLGRLLGSLAALISNRTRRIARRNIQLCFPELEPTEQARLVRASLQQMGQGFLELPLMWARDQQAVLKQIREVVGLDLLRAGLDSGHGVLLAAPHLGSWELLVQYLSTQGQCTFLYREPRDQGLDKVITQGRQRLGAEMVRAGSSGVRRLFKALREGRIVGLMPDQQPKRGHGVFAPFFAIPALTMVLYSKMAQRTSAPLLLAYVERLDDGGYRVHFVAADPAVKESDLEVSVAALNAQVEALVRAHPSQYQWGYKRFSMRPEGADPLY